MKYNWQLKDWPNFSYDRSGIQDLLLETVQAISVLAGSLSDIDGKYRLQTMVQAMVSEVLKSSEIEGKFLLEQDVYSSVCKHLGLKSEHKHKDYQADALSQIMVNAYETYAEDLTEQQLNYWHSVLFAHNTKILVGQYRTHLEAMQVVSGHQGKTRIHFEAPPSSQVSKEMQNFIIWFNQTAPGNKFEIKAAPIRAAIAHLYFGSIHPYEDGNGRLGRILAEKALAQGLGAPVFLCISQEIQSKKKLYYSSLEHAQKSNEISSWLEYFLTTLLAAKFRTEKLLKFVIKKSKFYAKHQDQLNDRQAKVIQRMLDEGVSGFKGGMSAAKYMKIARCSKATATRDLSGLFEQGILIRMAAGRSTNYDLKL